MMVLFEYCLSIILVLSEDYLKIILVQAAIVVPFSIHNATTCVIQELCKALLKEFRTMHSSVYLDSIYSYTLVKRGE